MQINETTKISTLIKENKKSIEAIAAIAKPLEKLKNPLLRKVMASRVTLAEAAKMGGCRVEDFAKALAPLGFNFVQKAAEEETTIEARPAWLTGAKNENIINFDVREILAAGSDPLKDIMQKFKSVAEGKILCIINSFIPTPLIHVLTKDGKSDSYTETIHSKEFHTYFLKQAKSKPPQIKNEESVIMDEAESFAALKSKFSADQIKEIDVRALEMPLPMQTILAALAQQAPGDALFVHHKRIPVYLLEELADKDFEVHIHSISETEVKMLIFKK